MTGRSLFLVLVLTSSQSLAAMSRPVFRADQVEPGKTPATALRALLGKPVRVVRESPHRELQFYDLGEGSAMDATVSVHGGVVEYVTYLCNESISEVKSRFSAEPSSTRSVESTMNGLTSSLTQVLYEARGRGFVYEPKSHRIRTCMAWEPGKKFDELGR